MCPIEGAHTHPYPPTPPSAFVRTEKGFKDARGHFAYFDPHPHHQRSCFRERWHLHLEPPIAALAWDDDKKVYRSYADTPLVPFSGRHSQRPCEPVRCTFDKPHAHRPCPGDAPGRLLVPEANTAAKTEGATTR